MKSPTRLTTIGVALLAGLLLVACARKPETLFERGFADGKRLGKERRMMSSIYVPPEGRNWSAPEREEYWRGFRKGDAHQFVQEAAAYGVRFKVPPTYVRGLEDGLRLLKEKGAEHFYATPEGAFLPPEATTWSHSDRLQYNRGVREAVLTPDDAKATLDAAKK